MLDTKLAVPQRAAQACCTCQRLLPSPSSTTVWSEHSEKPQIIYDRTLPCCGRIICAQCIADNDRFATYCPFCQISSQPSALPAEGLREPPSYKEDDKIPAVEEKQQILEGQPPSYDAVEREEQGKKREDVLHHLHHPRDTIPSLSLSYNVPPSVLRSYNNLTSDNLLLARHTILIPASHYSGPSLSTTPQVDAEEDERRKKIRRFMLKCKVSEYDVAVLYLEQAGWDEQKAKEAWEEDERWEKEHPLHPKVGPDGRDKGKGKGMSEVWRRRFTGKSVDEKR